jgi:ABC-type glycerol-3-phosphate transport system substrate-binding protein
MTKLIKSLGFTIFVSLVFLTMGCKNNDQEQTLKIALDIEDQGRFDAFFATFESLNPDIKISATYGQDLSKLIGTKDEPDLFKTGDAYIESIKTALHPLNDFITNDSSFSTDIFIESIIESLTVDNKLYALPTSINTSLLYYNIDLFDAHEDELRLLLNLNPNDSIYPNQSWTHETMMKAGVVLTKYTGDGINRRYTQYGAETQYRWWGEWLIYIRQYGGDFYQQNNNRRSALNSNAAIQGTNYMYLKSLGNDEQKFAPSLKDTELSFSGGKVGMIFGGHMGDWASYNALGLNWDIAVLPTPVGRPDARGGEIATDAFGISARSRNKEKAYRFLKYWVSEEGALQMYRYGRIGALKSMQQMIENIPQSERQRPYQIDALFAAMAIARPLPREKDFEQVVNTRVMNRIQMMLDGIYSPVEALNAAHDAVNRYYINLYGD